MPSRIDFRTSLDLACQLTGMRVALVGEITDAHWRAVQSVDRAGLGISNGMVLDINKTFCRDVKAQQCPVWFADAHAHPDFQHSPVPGLYGFRSYISVPITLADGSIFGTLCTLDPLPRPVDESHVAALTMAVRISQTTNASIETRPSLKEGQSCASFIAWWP